MCRLDVWPDEAYLQTFEDRHTPNEVLGAKGEALQLYVLHFLEKLIYEQKKIENQYRVHLFSSFLAQCFVKV